MTEYRIIKDNRGWFTVEEKYWWWPFWIESDGINFHNTVEDAEAWVKAGARNNVVVKNLGKVP